MPLRSQGVFPAVGVHVPPPGQAVVRQQLGPVRVFCLLGSGRKLHSCFRASRGLLRSCYFLPAGEVVLSAEHWPGELLYHQIMLSQELKRQIWPHLSALTLWVPFRKHCEQWDWVFSPFHMPCSDVLSCLGFPFSQVREILDSLFENETTGLGLSPSPAGTGACHWCVGWQPGVAGPSTRSGLDQRRALLPKPRRWRALWGRLGRPGLIFHARPHPTHAKLTAHRL